MEISDYTVNPKVLFNDIEDVKEFLFFPASIAELELLLKNCEKEQLFEYCTVINNKIKQIKASPARASPLHF